MRELLTQMGVLHLLSLGALALCSTATAHAAQQAGSAAAMRIAHDGSTSRASILSGVERGLLQVRYCLDGHLVHMHVSSAFSGMWRVVIARVMHASA